VPRSPLGPTLAALALLVPVVARAQPAEPHRRGRVAFRFGMRGQQGGVMRGGFRLVLNVGFNLRGVGTSAELDRQLGPDSRIADADGDQARWSEWAASVRVARPIVLAKGLRAVTTIGPALLHYAATGPIDTALPPIEVTQLDRWCRADRSAGLALRAAGGDGDGRGHGGAVARGWWSAKPASPCRHTSSRPPDLAWDRVLTMARLATAADREDPLRRIVMVGRQLAPRR
jgi:hypothetical protein